MLTSRQVSLELKINDYLAGKVTERDCCKVSSYLSHESTRSYTRFQSKQWTRSMFVFDSAPKYCIFLTDNPVTLPEKLQLVNDRSGCVSGHSCFPSLTLP